ncbi:hypothetical protein ACPWT1_01610 [Ramlibacter sp. MMS24-I3-19]|uniref:hypothetical protein n=1 Tax=Ramlibacter sp. MMS24-I3-19 TaxID=3416606 RepID=UPI003D062B4D
MSYSDLLRTALEEGATLPRAMEYLRGTGASPLEAASAVQEATGRTWMEAREVVAQSRAWAGPRSGALPVTKPRDWYGAIGQHGRSGHGAMSVLPHLWRPAPRTASGSAR